MKNNKKYEELKGILENIKKAVQTYNDLNPEDKLALTKQKEDVSSYFVCVHDDNKVDLFKRESMINAGYDSYCDSLFGIQHYIAHDNLLVYFGVDSHFNGIKFPSTPIYINSLKRRFINGGTITLYHRKKEYLINCSIQEEISFDDMRLIMYNEGLIGPYEIGKATNEEILEVLKYAYNYYGLDKKVKNLTK